MRLAPQSQVPKHIKGPHLRACNLGDTWRPILLNTSCSMPSLSLANIYIRIYMLSIYIYMYNYRAVSSKIVGL